MQPDRVLVVGCGFIGGHMAAGLAQQGFRVSVLSRRVPPAELTAVADVHVGDAADRDAMASALDGVHHVVWCAGGLLPPDAEADPRADEELTLGPLRQALGRLRGGDATITYLASGGTVYGNPDRVPVDEDAPAAPIGAYGRVRLEAERLVLRQGGPGARVLRCANVYGAHQPADRSQGAVAVFIDRVRRGEEIVLFDGGAAVRDFVHVADVVAATGMVLGRGGPQVLNVGSGRGTSIRELLTQIEQALAEPARVRDEPARSFDVERIVLDISRLRALVPYAPLSLAEGLARTVDATEAVAIGGAQ